MRSALYRGTVSHVRQAPKGHRFTYEVASLMIDLDDWEALGEVSPFLSVDRPGLMSVSRRDYMDGSDGAVKASLEALLIAHGISEPLDRARLFTYPRMLGYLFNPVSLYLCEDREGGSLATVYEVNNTFGERHHYVVPMRGRASAMHGAEKVFYVSPFMDVSGRYRFRVLDRDHRFALAMESIDSDGSVLNASFKGRKQALTAAALRRVFFRFPLMTLKVTASIHLEALRLWLKGLRVYRHKSAPVRPSHATLGTPLNPVRDD